MLPRQRVGGSSEASRSARLTGMLADDLVRVLEDLDVAGLRRRLRRIGSAQGPRVQLDGREVLCFCSNNYLGLAADARIVHAVQQAVEQYGWGAGASRLVSGTMTPHARLEERIARFKGTQAALVFPTGYMANLAAIRACAGPGDVIYLDKLNHASIIDAARSSGATVRVFRHKNYQKLERLLARGKPNQRRLIVTDTVFSMDGDLADLPRLVELKRRYEAVLCVDEAHATGVFGPCGRGVAEMQGVEHEIDVTVGTLSKALGGIGGFVCGAAGLIDYLINTARPFIYTTAMPPAACAAAEAAIDIVQTEPWRRTRVLELAAKLRRELGQRRGYDIGASASQIVPLIVGEPARAVAISDALGRAGFLIPPIRPPTVPPGTARLRISLMATHTDADIDALVGAIEQALPAPGRT